MDLQIPRGLMSLRIRHRIMVNPLARNRLFRMRQR